MAAKSGLVASDGLERVDRRRAQPGAALLAHDLQRPLARHRLAVRAVGGQRLEDVGDREDARRARAGRRPPGRGGSRVPSSRSWWVAAISARCREAARRARGSAACSAGARGSRAHSSAVEPAGLVEDAARDRELADVVQQPGAAQVAQLVARSAPARAPIATAQRATSAEWRAVNGDLASITRANASATRSSSLVVGASARGRRAPRRPRRAPCAGPRAGPRTRRRRGREQRVDERGVEPAAAALAAPSRSAPRQADGARRTPRRVCARQRIRPSSGISSPRRPSGWPPPSQCSSSARIAVCGGLRQLEHARDLGAALAARADHLARDLVLLRDARASGAPWPAATPPGATLRHVYSASGAGARPVDELHRALGRVVVGREQRRQPRGVARAARVLEQQRVEERRALLLAEPELLGRGACRSRSCGRRGRAARPR